MKTVLMLVILSLLAAGVAFAADASPAQTIILKAKNGDITFHHKEHEDRLKDCSICHGAVPGKIAGFNQEWAHKKCVGCHWKGRISPTKCSDCHKKK